MIFFFFTCIKLSLSGTRLLLVLAVSKVTIIIIIIIVNALPSWEGGGDTEDIPTVVDHTLTSLSSSLERRTTHS